VTPRSERAGAGKDTMSPFRRNRSACGCSGSKPRGTRWQLLVRLDRKAGAQERTQQRRQLLAALGVDDRGAETLQLLAVHHVLTGADEELAGTHVDVERRRPARAGSAAGDAR